MLLKLCGLLVCSLPLISCSVSPFNERDSFERSKPSSTQVTEVSYFVDDSGDLICARKSIGKIRLPKDVGEVKIGIEMHWAPLVKHDAVVVPGALQMMAAMSKITFENPRINVYPLDNLNINAYPFENIKTDFIIKGYLTGYDEEVSVGSSASGFASSSIRINTANNYEEVLVNYNVLLINSRNYRVLRVIDPARIYRASSNSLDADGEAKSLGIFIGGGKNVSHSKTLFTQTMMNSVAIEFLEYLLEKNLRCIN